MKYLFIGFILFLLASSFTSCSSFKNPMEKTVWDYVDGDVVSEADWNHGIESLHSDLIKSGYMEDHSCYDLDCYKNHQNTYMDVERVNKLVREKNHTLK